MAGFTLCAVDRALTGTWTLKTGSAVSGYPLVNLNDWRAGNQARFTPATNVVQLMLDIGAPSSAGNVEYHINCIGLVNHNLDGATITVKSHTSDDYANGTSRLAATALDADMGHPNLLVTFAAAGARYWYININATSLVNPVRIGRVIFGYSFDLGYPMAPWGNSIQPIGPAAQTATGTMIGGTVAKPNVVKRFGFNDPGQVTKNTVWNNAVTAATVYPTYNTLRRLFSTDRQNPISAGSATVYTGITAGSGLPMVYHEGDAIGISSAGRPAYYGVVTLDQLAMQANPTQDPIDLTIVDCNDANNRQIKPPTN